MYHADPNAGLDNYDGGSFGSEENLENRRLDNHNLHDDRPNNNNDNCSNYEFNASYTVSGYTEWLTLFWGEAINNPFQGGHYIYIEYSQVMDLLKVLFLQFSIWLILKIQ